MKFIIEYKYQPNYPTSARPNEAVVEAENEEAAIADFKKGPEASRCRFVGIRVAKRVDRWI
jgi:hypothetical protein